MFDTSIISLSKTTFNYWTLYAIGNRLLKTGCLEFIIFTYWNAYEPTFVRHTQKYLNFIDLILMYKTLLTTCDTNIINIYKCNYKYISCILCKSFQKKFLFILTFQPRPKIIYFLLLLNANLDLNSWMRVQRIYIVACFFLFLFFRGFQT